VESVYLQRSADRVLAEMVADHAAVMVVGPRATGKTTSCERLSRSVVRLGDPAVAAAFAASPGAILAGLPGPVSIDEWQEVPTSLQAVKLAVDRDAARGQFIVTGSVRGDLDAPTWPGTGRLIRMPMYGLTERETEGRARSRSWLSKVLAGQVPSTTASTVDLRGMSAERCVRGSPKLLLRPPTEDEEGSSPPTSISSSRVMLRRSRRGATRNDSAHTSLRLRSTVPVSSTTRRSGPLPGSQRTPHAPTTLSSNDSW
jgi:hypothetical protein